MKFAIREAVDVFFKAKATLKLGARTIRAGEPVLIFDSVKTSSLEGSAAITYVTGGRGNARLLSYEGDKALTFSFEEALLSPEGLAILAGANLIPARNPKLPGASPEAKTVISHHYEKYQVTTPNVVDTDATNLYDADTAIGGKPKGGLLNVALTKRPYVGQNGSIYVMLLDMAGEISGAPIEINLKNDASVPERSYLAAFKTGDSFVAFDSKNQPMSLTDYAAPIDANTIGLFGDIAVHFVDLASATASWQTAWGDIADFTREITATTFSETAAGYGFLLAPSGGSAMPKAFLNGSTITYRVNVPSILYGDVVMVDYYVENKHDAVQIDIDPAKFGDYFYVEGSSLLRRASDGADIAVEFLIPKFKVNTNFTLTLSSTGDPSTFTFQGDAYPDFTKFDPINKVLASIQIIGADDNYDGGNAQGGGTGDPTSYRRYRYDLDSEGEYLWKDPSIPEHSNLDYSDVAGPATKTPGGGLIDAISPPAGEP